MKICVAGQGAFGVKHLEAIRDIADVEVVRKVLPTNFYPKPKVDSAIVLIKPNAEKRATVHRKQIVRDEVGTVKVSKPLSRFDPSAFLRTRPATAPKATRRR